MSRRKKKVTGEMEALDLRPDTAELVMGKICPVSPVKRAPLAARWASEHSGIPEFRPTLVDLLDTSRGPSSRREVSNALEVIGAPLPSVKVGHLPSFLRGALATLDAEKPEGG